jgi:ATP-dependent Clp protease ATP-binding subunit ClpA
MVGMIETRFPGWVVCGRLDNGLMLAEALGFPEVSRLGTDRRRLGEQLRDNLRRLLKAVPLSALYRRHIGDEPAVSTVTVPLDPTGPAAGWREPLSLSFPILTWDHGGTALAFIPALGIEVVADSADALSVRLPTEIRAALARVPDLALPYLVGLQRIRHTTVDRLTVGVKLRPAKARALAAIREREQTPSVLARVATDLTLLPDEPISGLGPIVAQLAEMLAATSPRSVLLVGASGVGKTAAVRELARRRSKYQLGASPFWATSGARLVAGMSGYGMWQERCRQVVREAARRKAIVHLGGLIELMQVGKSEYNVLGMAAFLRPSLARGDLLAIAECTPEQLPIIEREDPHLLAAFHQLPVPEPDAAQGRAILRHVAANVPPPDGKPLADDTLDTLDRLHRRYATYSAYPGRPLRFLRSLLRDGRDEPTIHPAHVLAAFARETGLPRVLLDPAECLDLERTQTWLAERVIGQPEAVELVANLIAATKAGLTRPRRPIASLLFIGPTGVGKTEMAKALAEFLFGARDRLTRFDMSEFSDPPAVQRLAGVFGSEGLLTARVREQPFGVLLFDEFEKAHPLFFDLLLQVLGEGRLTDPAGRLADFTNTAIILTSNLGAESFQQGSIGFAGPAGNDDAARRTAARDHFVRAVQAFVRPELFNRIDQLVPFAPLGADVIRRIAERHLRRLETRDGIRYRGVALSLGAGVADHLAQAGFDARYGARPLLRAVERELLAPLAHGLNRHGTDFALAATVNLEDGGLRCAVKPRTDAAGRPLSASTGGTAQTAAAEEAVRLRRLVQALERCRALRELHNELFQLEQEQERFEKRQRVHAAWMARLAGAPEEVRRRALDRAPVVRPADQERMANLARLRRTAGQVRDLATASAALEDRLLLALYAEGAEPVLHDGTVTTASLMTDFDELLLTLYCREFPRPDRLTLALFAEGPRWLTELAGAYVAAARSLGLAVAMVAYLLPNGEKAERSTPDKGQATEPEPPPDPEAESPRQSWRDDRLWLPAAGRQPERPVLVRKRVEEIAAFLAAPPPRLPGLALSLRGSGAAPRFMPEQGLHPLRDPKNPQTMTCLVEGSEAELTDYLPPPGITRRGAIGTQPRRRTYDRGQEVFDDVLLAEKLPWRNSPLAQTLADAINRNLRRAMRTLLEE